MDSKKLKAEMIMHDASVDDICKAAGFGRSAWFRKISGKSEFTQSEILAISQLLDLGQERTLEIFFADVVS